MLKKAECRQADRVTKELITLPVHEYLTQRDRIQIQNVLKVASLASFAPETRAARRFQAPPTESAEI
jgi:hypothetical protein